MNYLMMINKLFIELGECKNSYHNHFFLLQNSLQVPGRYVSMEDTISGFEAILNGDCDDLPENAFMYVGTIDEAFDKAKS